MEMGCSRNELLYIAKSFQIWVFSAGTRFNPSMTCREIIPRMVFSYCGVWSRLIHFVGVGSGQTLYIVYIYIYLSIYLSIYLFNYLYMPVVWCRLITFHQNKDGQCPSLACSAQAKDETPSRWVFRRFLWRCPFCHGGPPHPKPWLIETTMAGWWFGTWLLFFYILGMS